MSALYQLPGLFLTAVCHAAVARHLLEQKYSGKKFAVLGGIYVACFVGMSVCGFSVGGKLALLAYVGIVIVTFLFSCIVSQDCFSKKCFLFITYFCLFSVLDNVLKLAVRLLLPQAPDAAGYYAAILMRSALLLLALALYKRYAAEVMGAVADGNRGWWKLALIALLFYLLQAMVSVLNAWRVMPDSELLFLFAAFSLVMCAVYGVVFSNISYMKKDAEAALVRQNAEYLSGSLSVLQAAEETNRRLRHDLRHHIEIIAKYAQIGDTSAILSYIGEYRNAVSEAAVRQYSLNRTVNSILSVYAGKAEEGGIGFTARCNVPREMELREIDIIALLGNLLENALHGCQESGKEKNFIEIHARLQNNRLIVLCSNTCHGSLKLSGGLPAEKGIGISSILSVCRKYGGNLDYRLENETCSACAVLNL